MRALACILTGLALIVLALLVEPYVRPDEGFQAQTQSLPTDTRTIRGLVIKASMQKIADKLPFIHSNFESIKTLDMTQNPPTETGNNMLVMPSFTDTETRVYYFKLKQPVDLVLTDEMIQMLKTASTNLLGGENLIGFWVTAPGGLAGTTYPTVTPLPATSSTAPPATTSPTTPSATTPPPTTPPDTTLA